MSTPTPSTKPIDLSECKVGQRVKLRNQQEERIVKINTGHPYPYACKNGITWDESGLFQHGKEHPFDIVAILPLPKKPAKKPLQPAKLMSKKDVRAAIKHAEATLKLLKGLIKP